jgi:hypothetical protein
MANDERPAPRGKRPYHQPVLKKIDLRPEEAVLGSCKTASTVGPGTGDCLAAGSNCFVTGS